MKLNKFLGIVFIIISPIFAILAFFWYDYNQFIANLFIGITASSIVIIVQTYTNYYSEFKNNMIPLVNQSLDLGITLETFSDINIDVISRELSDCENELLNFYNNIVELKIQFKGIVFWNKPLIKKEVLKILKELDNLEIKLGIDFYYLKEEKIEANKICFILNILKKIEKINHVIINPSIKILKSLGLDVINDDDINSNKNIINEELRKTPKLLYIEKIKSNYPIEIKYLLKEYDNNKGQKSINPYFGNHK